MKGIYTVAVYKYIQINCVFGPYAIFNADLTSSQDIGPNFSSGLPSCVVFR